MSLEWEANFSHRTGCREGVDSFLFRAFTIRNLDHLTTQREVPIQITD
jgi:hypothetical protein